MKVGVGIIETHVAETHVIRSPVINWWVTHSMAKGLIFFSIFLLKVDLEPQKNHRFIQDQREEEAIPNTLGASNKKKGKSPRFEEFIPMEFSSQFETHAVETNAWFIS